MSDITLIGESKAIDVLRSRIRTAARTTGTVLIQGETGTGKELVARSIHTSSARRSGPFVPIDCGAVPEDLVESELFGHRRGAFTTAVADKPGLFEAADQGTLFLDEIGNTSARFQIKLLRVLQERRVRRLGDVVDRPFDVRVIAATNGDLRSMTHRGEFREDLLYRLKVLSIPVPPLRQRPSDIPLLARHMVGMLDDRNGLAANGAKRTLARDALDKLRTYRYPGNVRELENIVESAYYSTDAGTIGPEAIVFPEGFPEDAISPDATEIIVDDFWESVARPYAHRALTRSQVQDVVRRGLAQTRGSYRQLVRLFNLPDTDYKRFMDFLRRHHCNVDFRPYRRP